MKTVLVTGGVHRIGQQICKTLHQAGFNLIIHYNSSKSSAELLASEFNTTRANSAKIVQANLTNNDAINRLCNSINTLDVLVNNASVFYPTPIVDINQSDYQKIMDTTLMGPVFLSINLSKKFAKNQGSIINIVDIHAKRPLPNHTIYNISKAAISMMTKTLPLIFGLMEFLRVRFYGQKMRAN
jgi:pteridine reductase